jgi:hypothetical protein
VQRAPAPARKISRATNENLNCLDHNFCAVRYHLPLSACVRTPTTGTLPWRTESLRQDSNAAVLGAAQDVPASVASSTHYRAVVATAKQAAVKDFTGQVLVPTCGQAYASVVGKIVQHLSSLAFGDTPDYGLLRQHLAGLPDTVEALSSGTANPQTFGASLEQLQQALLAHESPEHRVPAIADEGSAVQNLCEYAAWMRDGGSGANAAALSEAIGRLHPTDALAVVACTLGGAISRTPPQACNALAALLRDVAACASATARLAEAQHAAWVWGKQLETGVASGAPVDHGAAAAEQLTQQQ